VVMICYELVFTLFFFFFFLCFFSFLILCVFFLSSSYLTKLMAGLEMEISKGIISKKEIYAKRDGN
jgi:hypothetical protein